MRKTNVIFEIRNVNQRENYVWEVTASILIAQLIG
jgi:hypothetical protein